MRTMPSVQSREVVTKDYYRITPSTDPGPLTVRLWTSGISSLAARLTVYDSSGNVIATTSAVDPMHGDLSIHLPGLTPNRTTYFKVEGISNDVFSVGDYKLVLLPDSVSLAGPLPSSTYTVTNGWISYDNHTNDTFSTATSLQQRIAKTDARFDNSYQASISDTTDMDFYQVMAPKGVSGLPNVMTVGVWALRPGEFDPQVRVYDSSYQPVPVQVLSHDGGAYVVQVPNAVGGAQYYFKVFAGPGVAGRTGNYMLGVDFGTVVTALQTAASGTLTDAHRQGTTTLNVTDDTLFHFVLTASSADASVVSGLRMTIFDDAGNAVFTTVAVAGQFVSANVFLRAGNYRVVFAAGTSTGAPLPPLTFSLFFLDQGGDIDPLLIEPADSGAFSPTYDWGDFTWIAWLDPLDPYSDPFWY
jgi:hypothetical protein